MFHFLTDKLTKKISDRLGVAALIVGITLSVINGIFFLFKFKDREIIYMEKQPKLMFSYLLMSEDNNIEHTGSNTSIYELKGKTLRNEFSSIKESRLQKGQAYLAKIYDININGSEATCDEQLKSPLC